MRLFDAGMLAFAGWHALKGRVRGRVRFSDVREILGVSPAYVADLLALAGDAADGIPGVVSPSVARELIESRGHLADWIDRDLRVANDVKAAIEENRGQLRLNLRLVDLSEEAVGAPPAPLEAPGEPLKRAREVGERTGVGWLRAPELADEYALLREWGERTRERFAEVAFR